MPSHSSPVKFYLHTAILLVSLSFAGNSLAEISKCVDPATGKVSFTDHACPDKTPGYHQPIGSTNIDDDSQDRNVKNKSGTATQKTQAYPERYQNRAHSIEQQSSGDSLP